MNLIEKLIEHGERGYFDFSYELTPQSNPYKEELYIYFKGGLSLCIWKITHDRNYYIRAEKDNLRISYRIKDTAVHLYLNDDDSLEITDGNIRIVIKQED